VERNFLLGNRELPVSEPNGTQPEIVLGITYRLGDDKSVTTDRQQQCSINSS